MTMGVARGGDVETLEEKTAVLPQLRLWRHLVENLLTRRRLDSIGKLNVGLEFFIELFFYKKRGGGFLFVFLAAS